MASSVTVSPTLRVGPVVSSVGVIPVSIAVDAVYATPTGVTIDFATVLASLPVQSRPVFADLIAVAPLGCTASGRGAIFAKGTTASQFTCRLWIADGNGAPAELGDGAQTDTIPALLVFSPGAQS